MLVISRRKGQRVTIGDDIEIVVTAVHKNGVKLGIAAPRGFTVLRGEVRDAIFSANLEATRSSVADAEAIAGAVPAASKKAVLPTAKLAIGRQPADTKPSQSEDGHVSPPAGTKPDDVAPSRSARPGAPDAHAESAKPGGP
jgi:carbon storage regulator